MRTSRETAERLLMTCRDAESVAQVWNISDPVLPAMIQAYAEREYQRRAWHLLAFMAGVWVGMGLLALVVGGVAGRLPAS